MAQSITVVLTDDIDGSEATETVRFAIDGVWYEIDLNPANAEKIREVLGEWTAKARRTGAGPSRPVERAVRIRPETNPRNAAVRRWAAENSIEVQTHGRIPAEVMDMYDSRPGQ